MHIVPFRRIRTNIKWSLGPKPYEQSWAKIGTAVPRDFGTAFRPVPNQLGTGVGTAGTGEVRVVRLRYGWYGY